MPRFRLTIEYDGRPYVGWQRQATGPSVQATLEEAITRFAGHAVEVVGAGRTDAGVHALGMTAHADIHKDMTGFQVMQAANHHLGDVPIAVTHAQEAAANFHARFDAQQRIYLYRIINRRARPALAAGRVWHVAPDLDVTAMNLAAVHLLGRHDFTTFRHSQCQAKSPVKTLDLLHAEQLDEEVRVHAAARSFLHHQVRSMVGCLAWVGLGRWDPTEVKMALDAHDRARLAVNAPPDGLYFVRAVY